MGDLRRAIVETPVDVALHRARICARFSVICGGTDQAVPHPHPVPHPGCPAPAPVHTAPVRHPKRAGDVANSTNAEKVGRPLPLVASGGAAAQK